MKNPPNVTDQLMKTILVSVAMIVVLSSNSLAQAPQATIIERGPHHRVWQWTETDENGQPVSHSFTELATGLHYLNPLTGQLEESREAFEITATGYAVARHGPHQLLLAPNINAPVSVDVLLPDGQRLRSNPMGLSFFDTASGKNVLLGEVKDCAGELIESNVVVFPDAFTDIKGAIKYEYTKSGFTQDIILYDNAGLGSPEDYGLNPESTLLEMYSEFHNPPTPTKRTVLDENDLIDERLDFGLMEIGKGAAYVLNQQLESVPVSKTWTRLENRDFLVESVPYAAIRPLLVKADLTGHAAKTDRKAVQGRKGLVGDLRPKLAAKRMASIKPGQFKPGSAWAIDYSTINTSQTNYLFKGDTTYFISGNVSLFGTNTTFEGGVVLKSTNNVTLTVNTPVSWEGTPYRPVVLTGADDQSVGEKVGTNTLSGYYASSALSLNSTNILTLQNLRVAHAQTAITLTSGAGHLLGHLQLVNCQNGIAATNAEFKVRNALFHNVLTNFTGSSSTARVEHLTVDTAAWLNQNIGTNLYLTNCLLVAVTNYGSFNSNSVSTAGSPGTVFKTLGQGAHYLADNTYRNSGTTNLNATLAGELKKLTTYAPIELTNDFTVSTTLSPQAQRDTDTPDRGYHYDPLDYVWTTRNLTNATLTLTNGVAIGIYSTNGLVLRKGASFVSEGSPLNLNRLVRYQAVQEQPIVWGTTAATMSLLNVPASYSPLPEVHLRFTDVSLMANIFSRRHILENVAVYPFSVLELSNGQLRGGFLDLRVSNGPYSQVTVALTNNLTDRVNFFFMQGYAGDATPLPVYFRNNLFRKSIVQMNNNTGTAAWGLHDNLFDNVSLSAVVTEPIANSNNGYSTNTTKLPGSSGGDVTVTNFDYLIGPLGNFYYPTNGGNLNLLINTGSRNATNAGMYHFTVRLDQTKETNSTVDIGYHYVALDGSNQPIDTDGDSTPDYFEDRNGNGTTESGETDWQSSGDLGLKVWITEPKSNSNIP